MILISYRKSFDDFVNSLRIVSCVKFKRNPKKNTLLSQIGLGKIENIVIIKIQNNTPKKF